MVYVPVADVRDDVELRGPQRELTLPIDQRRQGHGHQERTSANEQFNQLKTIFFSVRFKGM